LKRRKQLLTKKGTEQGEEYEEMGTYPTTRRGRSPLPHRDGTVIPVGYLTLRVVMSMIFISVSDLN
jgi:hypothetical protein